MFRHADHYHTKEEIEAMAAGGGHDHGHGGEHGHGHGKENLSRDNLNEKEEASKLETQAMIEQIRRRHEEDKHKLLAEHNQTINAMKARTDQKLKEIETK